jgi:hypothetical protein
MATYTLFALLHPRSSRMDQFARYEAIDDETAIDLGARLSRSRVAELWSEHRQVKIFGEPARPDVVPDEDSRP